MNINEVELIRLFTVNKPNYYHRLISIILENDISVNYIFKNDNKIAIWVTNKYKAFCDNEELRYLDQREEQDFLEQYYTMTSRILTTH